MSEYEDLSPESRVAVENVIGGLRLARLLLPILRE